MQGIHLCFHVRSSQAKDQARQETPASNWQLHVDCTLAIVSMYGDMSSS
jgi:hypothetical protein